MTNLIGPKLDFWTVGRKFRLGALVRVATGEPGNSGHASKASRLLLFDTRKPFS